MIRKLLILALSLLIPACAWARGGVGCDSDTRVLLHLDGSNGSTTFTDENCDGGVAHSFSTTTDAALDTSTQKFGTASLLVDGIDDYISAPDSNDWDMFTALDEDITVDLQVQENTRQVGTLISQSDGTYSWSIQQNAAGSVANMVRIAWTDPVLPTISFDSGTETTFDGNWHHYAMVILGEVGFREVGIYYDGTQIGYSWQNEVQTPISGILTVGARNTATFSNELDGNIDEVRIQSGNYFSANPNSYPTSSLIAFCEGTDEDTTMTNNGYSGAITFNGTAKLDNGQTKLNSTTSLLLDGDSDYLSVVDSNGIDYDIFGTTIDEFWTVDLWARHDTHNSNETYVAQAEDINNLWGLIHIAGSGLAYTFKSGGANYNSVYGPEITDSNWHHIALIKEDSNYGVYLDGVQVIYESETNTDTFVAPLTVGARSSDWYFDGYLEQVQVAHANKFGVIPARLRIAFDGTDGATSYTAETGQTVTFAGTAQLDTAQSAVSSTSSLLLDGNSDYVTVPHSDDWDFDTGDVTVEMFIRMTSLPASNGYLVTQEDDSSNFIRFMVRSDGDLEFYTRTAGTNTGGAKGDANLTGDSTWHHVAFVVSGGEEAIYLDGTALSLTTAGYNAWNSPDLTTALNIGRGNHPTSATYFGGHIDELKIYKGWAKYTSNFTAPTSPRDFELPTSIITQDTITAPTLEYNPPKRTIIAN